MGNPTNNFNHLWNDLPIDERKRLMPNMIETQILHVWQCKRMAILAHKRHMKELNDWIKNLERDLPKLTKE